MKNKRYKLLIKKLKKDNRYCEYKKYFHHRTTRFTLLYIVSFFNKEYSNSQINELINLEFEFIKNKTKENFSGIFSNINDFLPKQYIHVDWNNFGNYFYYVWQTSLFYYDKKHHNSNIYIDLNYIKLNSIKREHYYKWINSLMNYDTHFNILILYIKKKGI